MKSIDRQDGRERRGIANAPYSRKGIILFRVSLLVLVVPQIE